MRKILEIKLTRDQVALIDPEDLERVSQYKWHCLKTGYAATSVGGRKTKKMLYLHRFIMNVSDRIQSVDHINKNKLDNRKSNLRICTHSENCKNSSKSKFKKTSKYKGVYFDKTRNKWTARIKVNYKGIFIGRFDNELQAAIAYDKAAIAHFGAFACLNQKT